MTLTKGHRELKRLFDRPRQKDIAKRIGISESLLSLLIAGKRMPNIAVASKIQKELGIPVEAWTR